MHYTLGQEVYGGHVIADIVEKPEAYYIYIRSGNEVKEWKAFNKNMGISVEFSLDI